MLVISRSGMATRTWSVLEILRTTEAFFRSRGIGTPRLDAELLLAKVLGCTRILLYTQFDRPLAAAELDTYRELVRRRSQRYPVHYLIGQREFFSRPFRVSPAVLIPRPETELLVEAVVALAGQATAAGGPLGVVDVGTGCGNIAISIACELPQAKVYATDISAEALEVARANAKALGVSSRVDFHEGDLLAALPQTLRGQTDFVVSNPPYIPDPEFPQLMPEVGQHEPPIALSGGPDGLNFYRRLLQEAPPYLRAGGHLVLELGAEQAGPVQALMHSTRSFSPPNLIQDYAGIPRVISASLTSPNQ